MIDKDKTWEQVMALRNRRQIPVCKRCHDKIHAGKYNGPKLSSIFTPDFVLYDNKIVHLESFIKPGHIYETTPLVDRGWKLLKK